VTIFGNDASKWQGDVRWAQVDTVCAFGWEKVSEGPGKGLPGGYVSERWRPEKPEMEARASASGFIPGGYLFLAEGDGARQAEFFAAAAGDMAGFMIAVDVEPRSDPATGQVISRPTIGQARACVARLRVLYPRHPVGGYVPNWYWQQIGRPDLTFTDYLWASHYVETTGSPAQIYATVPRSFWAGYGGSAVHLLQFTDKASVPGVDGPSDCSAWRGTPGQLRDLVLPRKAAAPTRREHDVHGLLLKGENVETGLTLPRDGGRLVFYSTADAKVRVDWVKVADKTAEVVITRAGGRMGVAIPKGCLAAVVRRVDPGLNDVTYLVD
jgi:hypothetical protein